MPEQSSANPPTRPPRSFLAPLLLTPSVSYRQSEPKDGLLSPVLSASELAEDGPASVGKRQLGRGGRGGGGRSQALSARTAFTDPAEPGAGGGGPAGGRGAGGGGVAGQAKSAMYEAFKQVGWSAEAAAAVQLDGAICFCSRSFNANRIRECSTQTRKTSRVSDVTHGPLVRPTPVLFLNVDI